MPPPPKDTDDAEQWFRERLSLDDDAEFEELSAELRRMAFRVAGVTQLQVVTDVWEALDRAVQDGTTFEDFKDEVATKLYRAWGREDPYRLETIFRNGTQSAYAAGRYDIMTNPVVLKLRPYWEFVAILDEATTPVCETCNGTLLPAGDSFWADHSPPLHHRCRSTLVSRTPEDALEQGVDSEGPGEDAQDGFGGPPVGGREPDLTGYPPALVSALQSRESDEDE